MAGPAALSSTITAGGTVGSTGGQMIFNQENALGSTIATRNADGTLGGRWEYDAYGNERSRPASGITVDLRTDFRFAGKHGYISDLDTGFDLLGARYYIPRLGRFLTQDPIGHAGGLNLYAYCENNPLLKIDPNGKQGDYAAGYLHKLATDWWSTATNPTSTWGNGATWKHFENWQAGKGPNSIWHNSDYMWYSFRESQTYSAAINYIKAAGYRGKGPNGSFNGGGISTKSHIKYMFTGDLLNMSAWAMGAMEWRAVRRGNKMNVVFWTVWSRNSLYFHNATDIARVAGRPNRPESNVSHYYVYSIDIPKGK